MTIKLGIDVGGTFTDFVVAEDGTPPRIHKTLSTPHDPSEAVVAGLAQIAAAMDPPRSVRDFVAGVDTIVHGTTVTTNATLTSTGARTALLTTEGVRDALEMRRGIREAQYDNRYTNVVPLVPRARRLGIAGRIDRDGREIAPLDLAAVRAAVQRWRDDGVQAVAVCFMNAFANPAHEQAAAAIVRAEWPEAYLSVSTEVLPAIRFYDRVSTTALNAYVGPKLGHYLDRLVERLAGVGFGGLLLIMQSNGGVITPAAARAPGVGRREDAGLRDGHLSAADLGQRREVAGWLRTLGPDLLIIPGAQNRHPDHSAAHHLLWDAAFLAGLERYDAAGAARRPQRIIETMERFPFAPSFVIGIDAVVEAKRESLRCYASQFLRGGGRAATSINHPDFLEQLLARDRYYGALGGCGYAEPFHSAQVPLVADPAQLLAPAPFDGAGRAS